jgi:hypothetical protein
MKQKSYINKQNDFHSNPAQNSDEILKLPSLENCIIMKNLNGALFSRYANDVSTTHGLQDLKAVITLTHSD